MIIKRTTWETTWSEDGEYYRVLDFDATHTPEGQLTRCRLVIEHGDAAGIIEHLTIAATHAGWVIVDSGELLATTEIPSTCSTPGNRLEPEVYDLVVRRCRGAQVEHLYPGEGETEERKLTLLRPEKEHLDS